MNTFSNDAEQYVLGSMMLDNTCSSHVFNEIDISDFYKIRHKIIFSAIWNLASNKKPFDIVNVFDEIKVMKKHWLVRESYLVELIKNTPTPKNVFHYIDIILFHSGIRKTGKPYRTKEIEEEA